MTTETENLSKEDLIEISAVSRLTGLSTHNLRVWESRHGVVTPTRSDSQRRLYSREDVRKLGLLKTLVDRGFSIGRLARLDLEQLEQRLGESEAPEASSADSSEKSTPAAGKVRNRRCRIAIAGNMVGGQFREKGPLGDNFLVVSEHATSEQLSEALPPNSADVLLIELATLFDDGVEVIQQLLTKTKARKAVVTYRFASDSVLSRIENDLVAITALRAPVNATEIRLACLAGIELSPKESSLDSAKGGDHSLLNRSEVSPESNSDSPPSHRYNPAELAAIAEITSDVNCECPQHLANLVTSLVAFEQYSNECENRNADDARLHKFLYLATADARRAMEDALAKVLEFEDLQIPN